MERKTGWALVGISKLVVDELLPAFKICKYSMPVALVSSDKEKASKVASEYGIDNDNIYNYDNFDEIKNNPEIDIVYIVLPNNQHAEFSIRAAKAGKHVICEKPMATSVQEAQSMIDACRDANKKLMIAYRIQYEPYNRLMRKWVMNNKFGKVKCIEGFNGISLDGLNQWRLNKSAAGGGALVDVGVYCINTFRFITGEEPESVSATSYATPGDPRFTEVEETILFQMKFPGGVIANGGASYSVHENSRYRCYADKDAWFGMDPAFPYNDLKPDLPCYLHEKIDVKHINQFAAEMDHMSNAVLRNEKVNTPGEEGLQDQKIIEAIYQSVEEGRRIDLKKITTIDTFRNTISF